MIQINFYLSLKRFNRSLNWSKEYCFEITRISFDLEFSSFSDLLSTDAELKLINMFKDSEASVLEIENFGPMEDKPNVLIGEFKKRGDLHEVRLKVGFSEDQISGINSFFILDACQQKASRLTVKISTNTAEKFLLDWNAQAEIASLEIPTFSFDMNAMTGA